VQQVARRLGWKVEQSTTDQNWDVCWMDGALQPEQLFRMHLHQKVNHFPGMYVIARKDCLGRALMRMRKHSPVEYDFFPLTWHLPSELGEFTVQF
jgi:tubulin polyglutamylase TTLL6/13